MLRLTWLLFTILTSSYICEAYKILVVSPIPARSHSILGYGLVKHLLKAGHEVTYITAIVEKSSDPKLRQIDVSKNFESIPAEALNLKSFMDKNVPILGHTFMMPLMTSTHAKTIENENVQRLLTDATQTFDLVVAEWLFSELGAGYAAVYDAPLIWLSSVAPHWMIMRLVDETLNPAYNEDTLSSNIPPFSFCQRIEELWVQIKVQFYIYMYHNHAEREVYETLLKPIIVKKGRQPASYDDVKFNGSLVLGNSHVSLGQATSLPENYKPIAGYHIDENVTPLSEDLQKIMDNSSNGVIYFSMGSNLKSRDMPDDLKKSLLNMFSGLKQTVLWKFEEDFPDVPSHIHILKWAPQQSILSHPNCITFITHGGLLSTSEAVHFGVPIIGIPVFADQFINIVRAVSKGIAKKVDLSYTMADDLKLAIEDIIVNPRYKVKVKELSSLYHDRPVRPGAELVHWVEHVVRTRGAPHLRSPALRVPTYQKMYLDLAAILIAIIISVILVIKRVYCFIFANNNIDIKKKIN